jgi:D-alanyl-D-alanine carboxypeptidase
MHNPLRTILFSFIVFAFALMVVFSWPDLIPASSDASVAASPACADISPSLALEARAAYAKDLISGRVLYQKNSDTQLPLASLTKLATIAAASDILSPDDTVTITAEDLSPEGDSGLAVGERWREEDLADYTLMVSANDGAHALAMAAAEKEGTDAEGFIREMNAKVKSLGMDESFFSTDTGLDISSTTASAYGSARDVATLISFLVENSPRVLEGTHAEMGFFRSLSGITHPASNTSGVIGSLEGGIASKTGYTDLAGGNLAIVFEPMPGRPVAAVVLGSSRDGRDTDMKILAAGAKTALRRMLLCANGS